MLNFNSVMVGTDNLEAMSSFYEKVFGRKPDMEGGGYCGWSVGSCFFNIGTHSEVHGSNKEPARMIFNLETKDVKTEFERIKATGATVVKEPYEMEGWEGGWIATFSDPDGNFFQLMTPWEDNPSEKKE